jgi:hypothetical protein
MLGDGSRLTRLVGALAFVFSITLGIAIGYVWSVGEEIEDKFKAAKRSAPRDTGHRD